MKPAQVAAAVFFLAGISLFELPIAAIADEAPAPAPKLTANQTSIQVDVEGPNIFRTNTAAGQAKARIFISNTGTATASAVSVTGTYEDGTSISLATRVDGHDVPTFDIAPNATQMVDVSFTWTRDDPATGWLVAQDSGSTSPAVVVPFQVRETIPSAALGWIFLLSVLLAAAIVFVVNAIVRRDPPAGISPDWSHPLPATTTWGKDSWASNITALGAILGTILATTGFLSDVFPGLATGAFLGMSPAYGGLLLLAPLLYTAMYKDGSPIFGGALVAGWVTIWAAMGELLTTAELLTRGVHWLPGWAVIFCAIFFSVLLGAYSRSSLIQVLTPAPPTTPPPAPGGGGPELLLPERTVIVVSSPPRPAALL
jgi:hypothetical protein